jgi:hypothetical protein
MKIFLLQILILVFFVNADVLLQTYGKTGNCQAAINVNPKIKFKIFKGTLVISESICYPHMDFLYKFTCYETYLKVSKCKVCSSCTSVDASIRKKFNLKTQN